MSEGTHNHTGCELFGRESQATTLRSSKHEKSEEEQDLELQKITMDSEANHPLLPPHEQEKQEESQLL